MDWCLHAHACVFVPVCVCMSKIAYGNARGPNICALRILGLNPTTKICNGVRQGLCAQLIDLHVPMLADAVTTHTFQLQQMPIQCLRRQSPGP